MIATNVILVDDDEPVLDSLSILMEISGFKVHSAKNGHEALDHIARGFLPDVVVTDYRMPHYDGLEFVMRIRSMVDDDLPVIILTGDTAASELHETELKNLEVLTKPADPDHLISRISALAQGKT